MNSKEKEMFDNLLKFANDSEYKIVEINFKREVAYVLDEFTQYLIHLHYDNGEWV